MAHSSRSIIATKLAQCFAVAALVVAMVPAALAGPRLEPQILYYNVDGTTLRELANQMRDRGPNGYWGYAEWWVNWSASCEVTASGTITIPRHTNLNALGTRQRQVWEDMVQALLKHEHLHIDHGVQAAAEIEAAGCRGAHRIINHWAAQDRILDQRTGNGSLDGVDLE